MWSPKHLLLCKLWECFTFPVWFRWSWIWIYFCIIIWISLNCFEFMTLLNNIRLAVIVKGHIKFFENFWLSNDLLHNYSSMVAVVWYIKIIVANSIVIQLKSSICLATAAINIFRSLTTLTMDNEKSRDSHIMYCIYAHDAWLAGICLFSRSRENATGIKSI